MESRKLLGCKRANADGVQSESVAVKVKASSTVKDVKPTTTYHKESIRASSKLSATQPPPPSSSSSSSSTSPSSSSSSSSSPTTSSHWASSTTLPKLPKMCPVNNEVLPITASTTSLSPSSSGSPLASSSTGM
ncbi:hypothetical protein CHUAL_006801 [Chamberlinius hualienensis]